MAKILIIDDEPQLRALLARIIGLEGYDVEQAPDCTTGLRLLSQYEPDVVLCDVKLPDGNGVELVGRIKEIAPAAEVILLTAYGNIPDGVQAIKNGAFDYITKGDDNNKILPLLSRATEKARMQRRLARFEAKLSDEHSFDRIIGSSDPRAAQMTKELYETFVKEGHCLTCDDVTAEKCKLVENTYRDINIAFANQLSEICAVAGIDVHELIALANRHPRVNILSPGLGVGGHCLAVDPWFLVERYQEDASLIHEARVINDGKPRWVMEQMEKQLKGDHSEKIGILGMAYKPDIDDMRESPSLHLAHLLQEKGYAVYGCEPNSTADTLEGIPLLSLDECLDVCDHVVIALGHREFLSPQARAKILSVPHYDCIGFEQGEKR